MLPGFNTNVRHRAILFHVQSEDSGRAHPHVITHLYHGGTIVVSEKSSYADVVDATDLPARVKELMEAQHRAVLSRLRTGGFDETDPRAARRRCWRSRHAGLDAAPATAPLDERPSAGGRRGRGEPTPDAATRSAERRGPSARASSRRSRSTR